MSSSSSMETRIQHPSPIHCHPISRVIDWDIISPRAYPPSLFDTTAWEESASKIFAFDDLKGEFINPFLSSPPSNAPANEVQDTLREIDDLIDEFMGWKWMLISSWKREQEEAISPKTRGTEWAGIPTADSPTIGVFPQVSLPPSHSSSLEVEVDPRSESQSLGSLPSDGTSVYSQRSPSPAFPFLPLKLTLNLPALRRSEKMPNLRKDYSSQQPTPFSSPSSEIYRNETISPIAITANYAPRKFSPDLLTSSPSTPLSPFPSFITEMDIDSLLADHSSEAYTFEDHDDWKGEADIFTLIPQSLLDELFSFFSF